MRTWRFVGGRRSDCLFDRMTNPPNQGVSFNRLLSRQHVAPLFQVTRSDNLRTFDVAATTAGDYDQPGLTGFIGPVSGHVTGVYLQPSGAFVPIPIAVSPLVVNVGALQTNNGRLMAVTRGGALWTIPWAFAGWGNQLLLNGVWALGAAFPLTPVWLAGFDAQGSTFRDLELSLHHLNDALRPGVAELRWGEDMKSYTPSTATITQQRATIITAQRNATGAATRGTIRQNGVLSATYTGGGQSVDAVPNRICVFGDPDGAGFGAAGSFCPAGIGLQELIWANRADNLGPGAQSFMETNQSQYYGIAQGNAQGALLKAGTTGATVNMPSTKGGLVAWTDPGTGLVQGFVTDANGNYIIQ
jgi:hypothetical protein